MEPGHRIVHKEENKPFSELSDDAKYWQDVYSSAVQVAQMMQRNAVDPYEAVNLKPHEIHMILVSARIYTFNEQLIFDVALQMLKERHSWSYGNQ